MFIPFSLAKMHISDRPQIGRARTDVTRTMHGVVLPLLIGGTKPKGLKVSNGVATWGDVQY